MKQKSKVVKSVVIAFALAFTALPQSAMAKAPVAVKGKATYYWLVDRNIASGVLSDSSYFHFDTISATLKYDISELSATDGIQIQIGAKKTSDETNLSPQGSMLTSLEINGVKQSPENYMGASDLEYQKVEGDTSVKVTIVMQASEFSSARAQKGNFGEIQIVPTVIISHQVEDVGNPGEYLPLEDQPIVVTGDTPGVSELQTTFTMGHIGQSVTLPANTTSAFADVEWAASETVAKNSKISATKLTVDRKATPSAAGKNVAITWCGTNNNFCRSQPLSVTKGYYSLTATNANESMNLEANGTTLDLKFATKKIYLSEGVAVRTSLTKGSVLTMSSISVTK